MANLSLKHIDKIYDNNVQAVFDFNLEIKDKEFIVFVGPSGCGKSTTLRMIAGLEEISGGELYIDGKYSNNLAPQSRDIAMVFQNYALYPHMSVYDNMAFGLRNQKVPVPDCDKVNKTKEELDNDQKLIESIKNDKELTEDKKQKKIKKIKPYKLVQKHGIDKRMCDRILKEISLLEKEIIKDPENKILAEEMVTLEYWYKYYNETKVPLFKLGKIDEDEINKRIMDAARILEISQYLKRKPRALSGGQCQRVALGRAIVRHAKVFLMDEPLSNLDAKLRVSMRSELINIHKNIGATTIYVTHDQVEAMTMADRIVCMKSGYIQQIGTPDEIYDKPANKFVATFIGSPAMNIVPAYYKDGIVSISDDIKFKLSESEIKALFETLSSQVESFKRILDVSIKHMNEYIEKRRFKTKSVKKNINILEGIVNENQVRLNDLNKFIETKEGKMFVGFRAEHTNLSTKPMKDYFKAKLGITEILGESTLVHASINDNEVLFKVSRNCELDNCKDIYFKISRENIYFFEGVGEKNISSLKK